MKLELFAPLPPHAVGIATGGVFDAANANLFVRLADPVVDGALRAVWLFVGNDVDSLHYGIMRVKLRAALAGLRDAR